MERKDSSSQKGWEACLDEEKESSLFGDKLCGGRHRNWPGFWKKGLGSPVVEAGSRGTSGGSERVKVNNGEGGRYRIDQGCGKKVCARRVLASSGEENRSSWFEKGHVLGECVGPGEGYEKQFLGLSSGGKSSE